MAARKSALPASPATSGFTEVSAGVAPDDERLVADAETLRALSDPLRLRILETMVARLAAPWTAKELARRLDVPQTRLYHHLELLLERDLIRVADRQLVSGILETSYRVAARSFRLDRRLLAGDSSLESAARELLHSVFDTARDDLARALRAYDAEDEPDSEAGRDSETGRDENVDRPIVSRGLARLSPARAAEFRARLTDLIDEYGAPTSAGPTDEDGTAPWSLLVAFYRLEARDGGDSDA